MFKEEEHDCLTRALGFREWTELLEGQKYEDINSEVNDGAVVGLMDVEDVVRERK